MGTSTNALLWFGVAFEGSTEDEDEIPEQIHALLYGDEADEDELYGDGQEWFAETGIAGVEFVEHCSGEYPMYGLAVAGTVTVARRGSPQRVSTADTPDTAPIVTALNALGVPVDKDAIGWHLASMWD